MQTTNPYKVILVFSLKDGQADEEIRRSSESDSFPSMLAKQPGFISLELVKINNGKTMSVQTWRSEKDWWGALESVKQAQSALPDKKRPSILESRDFLGGEVVRSF